MLIELNHKLATIRIEYYVVNSEYLDVNALLTVTCF